MGMTPARASKQQLRWTAEVPCAAGPLQDDMIDVDAGGTSSRPARQVRGVLSALREASADH